MKVWIAQLNPTVGALERNRELILDAYRAGVEAGADAVVVPELAVTGYPPRDLLDKKLFIESALGVRDELVAATGPVALVFGCVGRNKTGFGKPFTNVAIVARDGRLVLEQAKSLLPTYDVFDELRYFEPGRNVSPVRIADRTTGVAICEDFWFEEEFLGTKLYRENPVDDLAAAGCEVLLNVSASPWEAGKRAERRELLRSIARRFRMPIVYVNQVGGNDELLFDGSSTVVDAEGRPLWMGKAFETDSALVSLDAPPIESPPESDEIEEIVKALVLGLRDYLSKCGFRKVVIGLSGGIDSAVTASLAVRAIGSGNVTGITMPSPFSSKGSVEDSQALAKNLGIRILEIPIGPIYDSYAESFRMLGESRGLDVALENVQARIRGNLLMGFSNRTGAMVLSTGNKSELAVGYCTLYGDMAGGLSLLGDVYKTTVYRMAEWLNRDAEVIPVTTIRKPPSAELRPGQTDQDSLPPYDVLDRILWLYIERWAEIDEIIEAGFERDVVEKVLSMVDGNEFKRRQAAPTIRVSPKAFGGGRSMPIAQRWRHEQLGSRK